MDLFDLIFPPPPQSPSKLHPTQNHILPPEPLNRDFGDTRKNHKKAQPRRTTKAPSTSSPTIHDRQTPPRPTTPKSPTEKLLPIYHKFADGTEVVNPAAYAQRGFGWVKQNNTARVSWAKWAQSTKKCDDDIYGLKWIEERYPNWRDSNFRIRERRRSRSRSPQLSDNGSEDISIYLGRANSLSPNPTATGSETSYGSPTDAI